ncbi:type I restriction enzyme-like protein [Candidatus Symbiobacter mobilis]|uniref:Type I restriction enzyme-like protein n=1 Tax=Candidatus Symbiobacter mobilis CR TaxID=946483 RepID=U5NEL0_9BURK|nr:type I restriction enzyme-like protein [Candidatus Symbiobacter mobilis]AGX88594.1 type I restriction enzyme-like protein [Candidatus Symbiobacter mobilis CR]
MLNEQQLEDLCIVWFQETGWQFVHGPDIAPDGANPERADYRQVILRERLLAEYSGPT